jgi:transcriptional regulator with XRE-family HTH domain
MKNKKNVDDFEIFKKKVGKNLRDIRKNKSNISQFKLALLCDIDKNIPSLIELAHISIGLETLYKISKVLNCHPSIILLDHEIDKDIIDIINSRYNNF